MGEKKRTVSKRSGRMSESSDELAWRVHDNAKGWIVQVDVKSAGALAIEAAVLGFALALVTNSETLGQLSGISRWIIVAGLLLLFVSVVLSTLVLLPRTKLREPKPSNPGYLYFGHLRHWDESKLSEVLARNHVSDDQIASQVIKMSEIAWKKHLLLRWSLYFLLSGILLVGGLYLLLIAGIQPEGLGTLAIFESEIPGDPCL